MLRRWNSIGKLKVLVKPCFLPMTCLIKEITFFFINRMSYLDSNMLCEIFYASIGPQVLHIARTETDLVIRLNELILCLYGWKTKVVNVPVSFHYWKIYLGDVLRQFIRLQIQLINLLSFSLSDYFLCTCIFILCLYVCIHECILCVQFLYKFTLPKIGKKISLSNALKCSPEDFLILSLFSRTMLPNYNF